MGKLTGGQAKGTATKHGGRKTRHDGGGLYVEITVHFVGAPTSDEADDVPADAGAKQRHGAASPGGADGDVGRSVGRIRM